MEENESKLIIEVRKPENSIEEIQNEVIVDNGENEEVNNEADIKAATFAEINAEVEKFQEEVSNLYNKMKDEHKDEKNNWIPTEANEKTQEIAIQKEEPKFKMRADVTSDEITSTAQLLTDQIIQRVTGDAEEAPAKNGKIKFDAKKELKEINCKTIFEFRKTVADFDLEKVRIFNVKEDGKTISFLCHDGDFFAFNRINFKDGYEYTEKTKPQLSENLNSKIRKIPNVAKTRNILNIDDIETRIFDMTQYILLLSKKGQEVRILKVTNGRDINDAQFTEDVFDKEEYLDIIDDYELIEEELDREENSLKNRFTRVKEKIVNIVVNPFKLLKEKLAKTGSLKMLSEGRHSVFDKEN